MKRYFRRDGDWPGVGKGSVWLEFEGEWATRQTELYDGRFFCSLEERHPKLGRLLTDRPLREHEFEFYPCWRKRGWIPIAGDGCGDTYLLDTTTVVGYDPAQFTLPALEPLTAGTHPVYFKDHETDPDSPAEYVVASGLWTFLRFWLQAERWVHSWPFDRERVLEADPALADYRGDVPLPWQLRE